MDNQTEYDNPMKTKHFAFVEYASADPKTLSTLFTQLGFYPAYQHKSLEITWYQQHNIFFILNATKQSFASSFTQKHGPCACGMGFLVEDANAAYERALSLEASPHDESTPKHLAFPAISGIGDSLLYFVDEANLSSHLQADYTRLAQPDNYESMGLHTLDHLTHNVFKGRMDSWATDFYGRLFNFREIRFFDINGSQTGLFSRALTSPDGNIRIPLNESKDDVSQIAEYLDEYNGEGIQHIALASDDIYKTVENIRASGLDFLTIPDTYYELVNKRVPHHQEDMDRMSKNRILIDNDPQKPDAILLQIFTENAIGPIFFEIIQRKGNQGFGEGNFTALFESMELDQIRRGVLADPNA